MEIDLGRGELQVHYKGELNEVLDRKIEQIAKRYGYEFIGSGYCFKTETRDMQFKQVKK